MPEDTWKWWSPAKKPVFVRERGWFWENSQSLVLLLQLGAVGGAGKGSGLCLGPDAHRVLLLSSVCAEEVGTV